MTGVQTCALPIYRAYTERNDRLVYLGSEPMADPLRSDPRFARLLAKIGVH